MQKKSKQGAPPASQAKKDKMRDSNKDTKSQLDRKLGGRVIGKVTPGGKCNTSRGGRGNRGRSP